MAAVNIFKSQLIFLHHDVNKRALSGTFEAERLFLSEYNPIYISYLYITGSDWTGVTMSAAVLVMLSCYPNTEISSEKLSRVLQINVEL